MSLLRSIYLHPYFFYYLSAVAAVFFLSYWIPVLFFPAFMGLGLLVLASVFDWALLYAQRRPLTAQRRFSNKLSNGDPNEFLIPIRSTYAIPVFIELIDELPIQFQKRDFLILNRIEPGKEIVLKYALRPTERGVYRFGDLRVYAFTFFRIFRRGFRFDPGREGRVYPSIIQMQKYDFLAISNRLTQLGGKKIRRIGHSQEFEQIKEYVEGDDIRTINWKATAKRGGLMVNQYQDEKSQPVYSIVDSSRAMKMPFDELSLLDYAINSCLAFSNVALKKGDKVGLAVFSKQIDSFLPAASKLPQLNLILEKLYRVETDFQDANMGLLYSYLNKHIPHRGLLLFYTNFEHRSALDRQLPYLRALNKKHLLIVIFFENTELEELVSRHATDTQDVYHKTVAERLIHEKKLIQLELQKNGISSILTPPSELSIRAINAYLDIKARHIL